MNQLRRRHQAARGRREIDRLVAAQDGLARQGAGEALGAADPQRERIPEDVVHAHAGLATGQADELAKGLVGPHERPVGSENLHGHGRALEELVEKPLAPAPPGTPGPWVGIHLSPCGELAAS